MARPSAAERTPEAPPLLAGQRLVLVLFISLLMILLVCGCLQRSDRRLIVVLSSTPAFLSIFHGFKAQLAQLGYREDSEVIYAYHDIRHLSEDQVFALLKDPKPDLVFAFPTEAAIAAKKAARRIKGLPVVFAYAGIEGADLVESVRAPGDHITGVRFPGPEQIGKRLEMLRTIAPHIRRVWIGYDRNYPNSAPALSVLLPLAQLLGVEIVQSPVDGIEALGAEFERLERSGVPDVDALFLMPDTLNHSPEGWGLIKAFAEKHRLPLGGSFLYTVEQGALFGNANDLAEIGGMAAPMVVKIFEGIPAGTIPVVTPEQQLHINYKRSQELGLQLPEGLLRQASVIVR